MICAHAPILSDIFYTAFEAASMLIELNMARASTCTGSC